MGHCYLMMDDLQKAYTAYQQALYHLPNPKEPKLWYGIGILYDRYGSLEHAEEAFASVVRMDPSEYILRENLSSTFFFLAKVSPFFADYEKANEIYFRLGIIYKQQSKYQASLECFRYILNNPPRPLTEVDIWFQIGHVYEQQKEFGLAKEAYERVLAENPAHAKVLQQLGWLYHQSNAGFENQEKSIQFLTKSLESDANDSQSWYLLGRAYMAGRNFNKAYEAYQQAVYRDGKNPTFWCSIGVLYYQIAQYRDALDAYSRAIRLNPYISEVWFDLGSLYESCNNQISDAIDAYARAAELDPENPHIQQRLTLLRNAEARGEQVSSAPTPQDVHPTAYANNSGMPSGPSSGALGGGPGMGSSSAYNNGGPPPHLVPPGEAGGRDLTGPPPPSMRRSQSPPGHTFRDGPLIPNIDEKDPKGPASSHTALAPMNAQRSPPLQNRPSGGYGSERSSPRSLAYSRHAEYEREREREMEYERERMYGSKDHYNNGRNGPSQQPPPPPQGSRNISGGIYDGGAYPSPYPPTSSRYDPIMDHERRGRVDEQSNTRARSGASGPNKVGRKSREDELANSSPARRKTSGSKPIGGGVDSRASTPGRGNKKVSKPEEVEKERRRSGSNSSAGSNQPLASSNTTSQQSGRSRPVSRVVDEDYDEGAADALMGLAGAAAASASASAPAKEASPKDNDEEADNATNGETDLTQEDKTESAKVRDETKGGEDVDEKLKREEEENRKEVKERAEAAAAAEDEAERTGAIKSMLGKRNTDEKSQEEEDGGDESPGLKKRKHDEPTLQDIAKDDKMPEAGEEKEKRAEEEANDTAMPEEGAVNAIQHGLEKDVQKEAKNVKERAQSEPEEGEVEAEEGAADE